MACHQPSNNPFIVEVPCSSIIKTLLSIPTSLRDRSTCGGGTGISVVVKHFALSQIVKMVLSNTASISSCYGVLKSYCPGTKAEAASSYLIKILDIRSSSKEITLEDQ